MPSVCWESFSQQSHSPLTPCLSASSDVRWQFSELQVTPHCVANLQQGRTNPGSQVAWVTKFCVSWRWPISAERRCEQISHISSTQSFLVANDSRRTSYFSSFTRQKRRSQWPRGLKRRSAAARPLRSWFRIPPGVGHECLSVVSVVR